MASQFSVPIEVEVEGVGVLRGELKKYLAPLTFSEVVKRLPISGVAARWDYAVYILTDVRRGAEKTVRTVSPGDVLYCPPIGAIAMAFKATSTPFSQSVKLGVIRDDPSVLSTVEPGARIVIRHSRQVV